MRCPVCKGDALESVRLESGLPANHCPSCSGHWISGRDYWSWLDAHGPNLGEKTYEGPEITVADTEQAKLCPECSRIMLRYAVGHGTDFSLDHCSSCNGVWLDRGEWESLKGRNLHDDVNAILTVPWQTAARKEERKRHLERIYAKRFGDDFEEMKRVRAWLDGHPHRDTILAFLTDADPYSV